MYMGIATFYISNVQYRHLKFNQSKNVHLNKSYQGFILPKLIKVGFLFERNGNETQDFVLFFTGLPL